MKKLALVSGFAFLAPAALSAAVFYGKASGTGTTLDQTIAWYADEACTDTAGVVSPYAAGAGEHRYVVLGSQKVQGSSTFPDVTTFFGTDGVTVGSRVQPRHAWNMNAGLTLTFPHVTVFSSYFQINSDGIAKFQGDYTFVKTSESIEFAGVHITSKSPRGAELAGTFRSAEDVVVFLSGISNDKVTATSTMRLSGDFSAFKGSFVAKDMTFDPYSRNGKILDIRLLSPSAMGDPSAPRDDALVLANDSHLTLAPAVQQSPNRGITLRLGMEEKAYINADAGAEWTLTAPLAGSGTLVKEGGGKVVLNGATAAGSFVVQEGTLELGPDFTFVSGATVTVKAGARIRAPFPEDAPPAGLAIIREEGAEYDVLRQVCHATDAKQDGSVVLNETTAWSDGQVAHGGVDYVIDNGAYYATASGWNGDMTFPGASLELANGSRLIMRTVRTVFTNLVLNGGTRLQSAGCYLYTTPHVIRGRMTVQGSTYDSPVHLTGQFGVNASGQQNRNAYRIEAELAGDGWLNFGGSHPHADFAIVSTNGAYRGGVSIGIAASADLPLAIAFPHPESLGGALDAFNAHAIGIRSAYCGIRPTASMVYAVPNRGLTFIEAGEFIDTPAGVTFAFMNEVRMRKGLRKIGPGTLALGGPVRCVNAGEAVVPTDGANNRLQVESGSLMAVNGTGYADVVLAFAAGTGIDLDSRTVDEGARTFGIAPAAFEPPAEGAVTVRLADAADVVARKVHVSRAVCTVPAGTPDLSDVLVVEKPGPRYGTRLVRETLADGRVRYTAEFSPLGLTIVVR